VQKMPQLRATQYLRKEIPKRNRINDNHVLTQPSEKQPRTPTPSQRKYFERERERVPCVFSKTGNPRLHFQLQNARTRVKLSNNLDFGLRLELLVIPWYGTALLPFPYLFLCEISRIRHVATGRLSSISSPGHNNSSVLRARLTQQGLQDPVSAIVAAPSSHGWRPLS
jgi:hypothetical protein